MVGLVAGEGELLKDLSDKDVEGSIPIHNITLNISHSKIN